LSHYGSNVPGPAHSFYWCLMAIQGRDQLYNRMLFPADILAFYICMCIYIYIHTHTHTHTHKN
jgi:hypothetical protein